MPSHLHIVDVNVPPESDNVRIAICKKRVWRSDAAGDHDRTTCPHCAKLHWAKRLAEAPVQLTAVKHEVRKDQYGRSPIGYGVNGLYRVMRDGEQIGWVWSNTGWGAGWSVAGFGLEARDKWKLNDDVNVPTTLTADDFGNSEPLTVGRRKGFIARDEALYVLACALADPAKRDDVECFWPVRQHIAYLQARVERVRDYKARQAAAQASDAAARTEATAQLLELHARADITNYQRAGLSWALEQLKIKIPKENA